MNLPKVSIVITCYNYAGYVGGALESVLNQSYQDFEIIIIDDGSTDGSGTIIKPFLSDCRLKYFYQKNSGQAKAKNKGVKKSKGKLVAFLDADDLWQPDKLEKQLALFDSDKIGVVYSRQSFIDEQGNPVERGRRCPTMLPKAGKVTADLFMDNFVPFSSSMVRSECFEQFGGFDESLAMGIDWDLWLRFSTKYHFTYVDEPLLIYRIGHSGQMSKNTGTRQECSDRIMQKFRLNYPREVPMLLNRRAMAFTYCNRGAYFRHHDIALSTKYYLKALWQYPLWLKAFSGLLKNSILAFLSLIKKLK